MSEKIFIDAGPPRGFGGLGAKLRNDAPPANEARKRQGCTGVLPLKFLLIMSLRLAKNAFWNISRSQDAQMFNYLRLFDHK